MVGVLGIVVVAGGWWGWRWFSAPEDSPVPEVAPIASSPDPDTPAPVLAPPPAPETHQAYSLALGSFRETARAERLVSP